MAACTQRELAPEHPIAFDPSTHEGSQPLQISSHFNATVDEAPTTRFRRAHFLELKSRIFAISDGYFRIGHSWLVPQAWARLRGEPHRFFDDSCVRLDILDLDILTRSHEVSLSLTLES